MAPLALHDWSVTPPVHHMHLPMWYKGRYSRVTTAKSPMPFSQLTTQTMLNGSPDSIRLFRNQHATRPGNSWHLYQLLSLATCSFRMHAHLGGVTRTGWVRLSSNMRAGLCRCHDLLVGTVARSLGTLNPRDTHKDGLDRLNPEWANLGPWLSPPRVCDQGTSAKLC
jgi:hypothetical protein